MSDYAIYLRKSRADVEAESRGEGETLARHQAQLFELAKRQGLIVNKIYKEIVSGENIASRPQMQELLEAVSDSKYDGVIVMEIERLARGDTIDQGVVAQAFKSSDTKIVTPTKIYDPNNEFDEEYFEFSLFMSRREYKTIRRRMQAGRLASVKEGNYIGASAPYGYKKIHPEPKVFTLEIIPNEAETIKMIYNLYLSGKGPKAIATELNNMGIPPQKSNCWEKPSINKILSNPLYIGKVQWKTKSNGDTLYDGRHEAIIDEETYNEVQIKRENNPIAQTPNNLELLNYYHDILYCGNCGHQLRRRLINGQEHLLCLYNQCRGKVVSSKIETVDEAVLSAVKFRIKNLENMQKQSDKKENKPKIDKKKPLLSEQTKLIGQRTKLYELLEQGIYDANLFLERSAIINEKLLNIEQQLEMLNAEKKETVLPPQVAISELKLILENFNSSDANGKNRLLRRAIKKMYYSKSTRACKNNLDTDLSVEVEFL